MPKLTPPTPPGSQGHSPEYSQEYPQEYSQGCPPGYPQEPNAITRLSFERVRNACPIETLPEPLQPLAVRMIHACGNPEIFPHIRATKNFPLPLPATPVENIPVLCDSAMLRIAIRQHAPHAQCLIHNPKTKQRARQNNITKGMAAIDLYCENNNAVSDTLFLFGAAPTALLRLLQLVREQHCPLPKAVFAFPVGFVSAVESKQALLEALQHHSFPAITLLGTLGGSAIAAAAFNATFERQTSRQR